MPKKEKKNFINVERLLKIKIFFFEGGDTITHSVSKRTKLVFNSLSVRYFHLDLNKTEVKSKKKKYTVKINLALF